MRRYTRAEKGRARPAARGGFTLVEVMIALAVLSFGMLALAAMQIHALRFGRSGRHTSQAAVVVRNEMEQLQRLPWASLAPTGGWTAPVQRSTVVQGASGDLVEQAYAVSWRVSDAIPDRMRAIDVRAAWSESNRPDRGVTISTLRWNEGT